MIKLPRYKTIEVKEFYLKPNYSGNPFTEFEEYQHAVAEREKDISAYRDGKIGKKYNLLDYPKRTNIQSYNNGEKIFYHVSRRYYALDYTKRILVSGSADDDLITAIFQVSINLPYEQKSQ